jgi:dephospho-CoA kinase
MSPCQSVREPRASTRYRSGDSPVVGLIGGIGGGKSQVAAMLKKRGAVVIDADAVGHELLRDPLVLSAIVERFGPGVLAAAGDATELSPAINRKALGEIVFADPGARRDLEAILHPRMRDQFHAIIARELGAKEGQGRLVVLDAAILLEAGWDDLCDLIVFVDAERDERLRRVREERGWSREVFEAREHAQWPIELKRRRADLLINNNSGVEALRQAAERIDAKLAELSCPMVETA